MFRFVICCVMPGLLDSADQYGSVDHVTPGRDAAAVLQKYSWEGSARRMLEVLREP